MKEIWKDIPEYEGLYQINNFGFVRSLPRNGTSGNIIYLSAWFDNKGYQKVTLSKNGKRKQFPVHRLVAQVFIPNPNNDRDVRFKDGNRHNVASTNLEWCNISNIPKNVKKGCYSTYAKFDNNTIAEIKSLFIKGDKEFGCNGLARKYGVSKSTMSYLLNNKTYK